MIKHENIEKNLPLMVVLIVLGVQASLLIPSAARDGADK